MSDLGELYVDFALNFKEAGLSIAKTSISDLSIGALAAGITLDSLVKTFFRVGGQALDFADKLYRLRVEYGINSQALQGLEKQALAYGASIDTTQKSVQSLQTNLAAFQLGHGSQSFMQAAGFLGLNIGQGTTGEDLFAQLRKRLPEFVKSRGPLGRAEGANLLQQLGVSPDEMPFLLGEKTGRGKGANFKSLTERQIDAIESLKNSIDQDKQAINLLTYKGFASLAVPLNTLAGQLAEILNFWSNPGASLGAEAKGFFNWQLAAPVLGSRFGAAAASLPHYVDQSQAKAAAKVELNFHQTNHVHGDASPRKIAEHAKRAIREEMTRATSSINRN